MVSAQTGICNLAFFFSRFKTFLYFDIEIDYLIQVRSFDLYWNSLLLAEHGVTFFVKKKKNDEIAGKVSRLWEGIGKVEAVASIITGVLGIVLKYLSKRLIE